jgi:hypothetical protein
MVSVRAHPILTGLTLAFLLAGAAYFLYRQCDESSLPHQDGN